MSYKLLTNTTNKNEKPGNSKTGPTNVLPVVMTGIPVIVRLRRAN